MTPKNTGFTLIEIVLAISLSALLLTIVYWTYFSINRSIEVVSEEQDSRETGRILHELIRQDLRGVVTPKYPFVSKTEMVDGKALGEIYFVTTSRLGASPYGFSQVGYSLAKDKDGQVILVRKELKDLTADMEQAPAAELSRIVTSFEITFYDGSAWVNQWDSRISNTMPKQVRVSFEVIDAKGRARTFTSNETIASAT